MPPGGADPLSVSQKDVVAGRGVTVRTVFYFGVHAVRCSCAIAFSWAVTGGPLAVAVEPGVAPSVRPMSTDRPDTTESPYTVPRGLRQIEASIADFSRDMRGVPGEKHQWIFGQVNLKWGAGQNTDFQCILNTHAAAGQVEGGDRSFSNGFGDVTLRLKYNLWGNDEGRTAFALMPYVSVPTHTGMSERTWAGGLILPFAIKLNDRFSLGLMSEVDFRERAADDVGRFQWLQSATLGVAWTERLGTYHELVAMVSPTHAFQSAFNTGVTYQFREWLIFDVGTRIGLSSASPDLGVFSGFSVRF